MKRRIITVLCLVTSFSLVTGCATLPRNNSPQALREFEPSAQVPAEISPTPDQEADLILREFFTASAHPTSDYAAARSFLTDDAAGEWNPSEEPLIVDQLSVTTMAGGGANERSFQLRGRLIGRLVNGGSYQPENASFDATIVMNRVEGQWRISSLPQEVVMERTELLNHFEPHNLYFYNSSGLQLVADRRWVYSSQQALDTVLISMLMEGPSSYISPAVVPAVPEEAEFAGKADGVYTFTGFQEFDAQQRLRFGAQLTWTLAAAEVPQPYEVTLDDQPVAEGYESLTPDDFADLNPNRAASQLAPLYTLSDGQLYTVAASESAPVEGSVGELGDIASADISAEGSIALVRRVSEQESVLYAGALDTGVQPIISSESITRPTFEPSANATWFVMEDDVIVRVSRDSTTSEFIQEEVEFAAAEDLPGEISELQLSSSGSRAAILSDGQLFVGVVANPEPGIHQIVNLVEIAPDIGGAALTVEWNPDGSLLVGTGNPESPIWRVEHDGSAATVLPATNISAPVVAVAASATTLYATDNFAIRQLPVSGTGSGTAWRDVPGQRGVRSAPIVAN